MTRLQFITYLPYAIAFVSVLFGVRFVLQDRMAAAAAAFGCAVGLGPLIVWADAGRFLARYLF
jgi:hypothetical protein